uniref:Leucine zipper tumor suppressor 3 n=1 Tax=Oncorhynchus mykiss TaxID=8022 RepID=A0A8C7QS82_ONCMY
MGSVGSGVAGEQEFAMKSVGTRTTLPHSPALSCHCTADRSCRTERLPPETVSEGTASSDERGSFVSLDVCSNLVGLGGNDSGTGMTPHQHRETGENKTDNHNNPPTHNPPKILPVSGKLEQNSGLVRPSAFKPVVPKSFHSMQNLLDPTSGGGCEGRGAGGQREEGAGGGELVAVPEALLLDQDSPGMGRCLAERAGGGKSNRGVHGGMSASGRNSLTSLPTYAGSGLCYGPQEALGSLSASTSNINRLGTTAGAAVNGLSASYSDRSSLVKSSSSYQQLNHLGDTPAPQRPTPSSDDVIQDLENRLWEKEQEVQHMCRNLEQSEAAIVQVFEEKQRVWERQMDELGQNYASRLQQVTRRAQRSQNALQAQITRLSQDKRRLQEEMAALLAQREDLERKCLHFRMEQTDILPRLDETKWEVCQKAGEISLLKQQLRESQVELTQRAAEMVALRGQLKEANSQLRDREEAMLGLKNSYSSKSLELESCQGELRRTLTEPSSTPLTPTSDSLLSLQSDEAKAQRQEGAHLCQEAHFHQEAQHKCQETQVESGNLREQLDQLQGTLRLERQQRECQALSFDQERDSWIDEKEHVLKYQAQLQVSYVETLQKNQALEQQVGQLGSKPTPTSSSSSSPSLLQLPTPWAGPSRLERIESTEI